MKKKWIGCIFIVLFCCIGNENFAIMMPQPISSKDSETSSIHKQPKKSKRFIQSMTKRFKKRNTSRPTDDLWILQVIFLVAFFGIVTFALSAIMLAIYGYSVLWLTLMIIGGVIGVLPMLIIGAALLFRYK